MKEIQISKGERRFDAESALLSERIHDGLELRVGVPYLVNAQSFVYEVRDILQTKDQSGLLARSAESAQGIFSFSARMIDGIRIALQNSETEPLQAHRLVENALLKFMEEMGLSGNDASKVLPNLLNVINKYQMQTDYNALLFQTTVDQMSINPIVDGDNSIFSIQQVASLISSMNDLWARISVGLSPVLMAETILSLFGSSSSAAGLQPRDVELADAPLYATSTLANFADKLYKYLVIPDGPIINCSFTSVESQIRRMVGMESPFTIDNLFDSVEFAKKPRSTKKNSKDNQGHFDLESKMSFIHKLSRMKWPGGFHKRYLSLADLYFHMIQVKVGHYKSLESNIVLGDTIHVDNTLSDILSMYSADLSSIVDFRLRIPRDIQLTKPDATFEDDLFRELYFYALIKRLLTQTESPTAGLFLNKVSKLVQNKENQNIAALCNTAFPVLGTCYDAFMDVAAWLRTILRAPNFAWEGTAKEEKYFKWLGEYFDKIGQVSDSSMSPRYMYSSTDIVNRTTEVQLYSPQSYISDDLWNDRTGMIIDPADFSRFRYVENKRLSGDLWDAPIDPSIDIRFLMAPYAVSAEGSYIIPVNKPIVHPLTNHEIEALTLMRADNALNTPFSRLYLQNGKMFSVYDLDQLSAKTKLPQEWLIALGLHESLSTNSVTFFLQWPSINAHYIVVDPKDLPVYEIRDSMTVIGENQRFKAIWPFLTKVQSDDGATPQPLKDFITTNSSSVFSPEKVEKPSKQAGAAVDVKPVPPREGLTTESTATSDVPDNREETASEEPDNK